MATYKQPALTPEQQVDLLKQKGLTITDEAAALYWLTHVSYYRLKHYTYTFKDINQDNNFIQNSTFDQLLQLYLFDRRLKLLLFDALENVEIAFKTLISNTMSCQHGPHWYMEEMYFLQEFDHGKFIAEVKEEFLQPDEASVDAYRRVYKEPDLPPSWMIMEFLTFGTVSKLFVHLGARPEKLAICAHFGLPDNVLNSWLHCFTLIRNKCAHHSRLVYRSVKHAPVLPSRKKHRFLEQADEVERSSLYCALCCLQFLVAKINPQSQFKQQLLLLISDHAENDYAQMGFPQGWESEALWT